MNFPLFFISDVHLRIGGQDEERDRREELISFINHIAKQKGTLFIVGDFFDFWFEYKYVMPKAYFNILTALYQAKLNGAELHYVLGNHDYWVGNFIEQTLFYRVYHDNVRFEANGKQFLITHGDGILSWDRGYRTLKRIIRNRLFMFLYRWLHPDLGYAFARWVSRRSRHYTHSDEYNEAVIGELNAFADEQFAQGVDIVIAGHYHQAKHVSQNEGSLVILGDWIKYRSFGYFDGNEFSLNYWR